MAKKKRQRRESQPRILQHTERESTYRITRIAVEGFKSFHTKQGIEIRPLTILAGANSSGKSSLFQPLLLLKQTVEESYDPGPLMLHGPNVSFSSMKEILSRTANSQSEYFTVEYEVNKRNSISLKFGKGDNYGAKLCEMLVNDSGGRRKYSPDMSDAEIESNLDSSVKGLKKYILNGGMKNAKWEVLRDRCFFDVRLGKTFSMPIADFFRSYLRHVYHLPGLRGNPERAYALTAVENTFPGLVDKYVATVVLQWQNDKEHSKLEALNRSLSELGLATGIAARAQNDTQVELTVARTKITGIDQDDLVNIADVGLGVTQTLPLLIALLLADDGDLVLIEQPELHLHPKAQIALAGVLANAAKRGVQVVIETHSSLILRAIQALVAERALKGSDVMLNWFQRDAESGSTKIISRPVDEEGAFDDWPEDFDETSLDIEMRYLNAVESIHTKNAKT